MLISINELCEEIRETGFVTAQKIKEMYSNENLHIEIGYFEENEILRKLSCCTHFLFWQTEQIGSSGSMRFVARLGRPVISIDNFQATEIAEF